MAEAPAPQGVRVFISYAHVDEALRARLRTHLSALEREGLVQAWDDRAIVGGEDWAVAIDAALERADVVLLLVTADFIQSDYCYGRELGRALERHADAQDRAIVIPVVLKRCDWETSAFAQLQALPQDARPLAEWKTEDDFYTAVAKGLRQCIGTLQTPDGRGPGPDGPRLRAPPWWRRPAWRGAAAVVVLALAGATAWWWQAAGQADGDVALALQALRSGRYADAAQSLEPACARPVNRGACFALAKARLGMQLEQPDTLQLERFAARIQALQAQAPQDPDLLLMAAELVLREGRTAQYAAAFDDIERAIRLAGGRYPEAHFYLANLKLLAGQFAAALPLLDQAVEANTVAPEHYLNARAYARAQTGDAAGAVADYERSAAAGSILSRIEMAPLLWSRSEFERAADQLLAASRAWPATGAPPAGRNALPWAFDTGDGRPLVLKLPAEKHCLALGMARAGLALAGRTEAPAAAAPEPDCGPEAARIRSAVASMLNRAVHSGMDAIGQQRATDFARKHNLTLRPTGGA